MQSRRSPIAVVVARIETQLPLDLILLKLLAFD